MKENNIYIIKCTLLKYVHCGFVSGLWLFDGVVVELWAYVCNAYRLAFRHYILDNIHAKSE